MTKKRILGLFILAIVFIGLSKLPLKEYLNAMIVWFENFGAFAPILYFLFFTLTSALIFPVFMLSIAAGILFGLIEGLLVVSLGNLASCTIMFLLARHNGRDWFENKLKKYKSVQSFSRAIESEGWKMLFMLRVVPIVHMILLNVSCGLSKVRLKDYMFGTWLGMLPLLVLYVYLGSLTDTMISSPRTIQMSGAQNVIVTAVSVSMLVAFGIYMKQVMGKYLKPAMVKVQKELI